MEGEFCPFTTLPIEIYEEILKYLSERDLLNVTLVSREFHDVVFNSKAFMSKIFVRISVLKTETFQPSFIMMSKRKYQNVKISSTGINQIDCKPYSWFRFLSCEILEKFADSIIFIESDIDIEKFDVDLPRLKTLKFTTDPLKSLELFPNGLISKLTNVENLILIYPMSIRSKSILISHFKANSRLKNLFLNESMLSSHERPPFFHHRINTSDIKMKLKKFSLVRCFWRSESHWEHIINFLKSQKSTLEYLKIDTCSLETFKTLLNELQNLETFEGNFYKIFNENLVKVPRNFSIKHFKMRSIENYEKILANSLKALKVLKIFQLSYSSLQKIMSLYWPSLIRIEYCHYLGRFADSADFQETFEDLLKHKYPLFNRRIKFVKIPTEEMQTFF